MKVKSKLKKVLIACALISALAVLAIVSAGMVYFRSDRNLMHIVERTGPYLLYDVVHDVCVPNQRFLGVSAPCESVHLGNDGYAVLRDIRGNQRLMVSPTAKIEGIESELLLRDGAPNYFADAWSVRTILETRIHKSLPREQLALAINAKSFRSQDQLHIHVGCVLPQVRKTLGEYQAQIGSDWTPLPFPLSGLQYQALLVGGDDLNRINPFQVLADKLPGARVHMADYTLAVVGTRLANGEAGFILLAATADPARNVEVHAEDLLDTTCGK